VIDRSFRQSSHQENFGSLAFRPELENPHGQTRSDLGKAAFRPA
jgi:hypothetical protein